MKVNPLPADQDYSHVLSVLSVIKSQLLRMKSVFRFAIVSCQLNICNFQPLEIMGRGSETQF